MLQMNPANLSSATQLDRALSVVEDQADAARYKLNARILTNIDDEELYQRIQHARAAIGRVTQLLANADAATRYQLLGGAR